MTDDTYNGWTNRETWAANLWLSNDQSLDAVAHEIAARAADESRSNAESVGIESTHTGRAFAAGRALVEYLESAPAELRNDVGSLWRIDESELGAAFLPEDDAACPNCGQSDHVATLGRCLSDDAS